MAYEDIQIELARTIRECEDRVHAKLASEQLGEAFVGIEEELAIMQAEQRTPS
jgi:hypothetical protein